MTDRRAWLVSLVLVLASFAILNPDVLTALDPAEWLVLLLVVGIAWWALGQGRVDAGKGSE